MRKLAILAAAAAFVGSSTYAHADGIDFKGSYKDAPVVEAFNWGGFYFGASVGFGAGTASDKSDLDIDFGKKAFSLNLADEDNDFSGAVYGLHMGYNLQRGAYVFGLEATISGAEFDSNNSCGLLALFKCETEFDYYGTVVGRLGYAVDRTMFYVVGGLAYAQVDSTFSLSILGFDETLTKNDDLRVGWTGGVGIEHALTERFIIRIEYAHVDLGEEKASQDFFRGIVGVDSKSEIEFDTIRIGASFKLDRHHEPLEPLK